MFGQGDPDNPMGGLLGDLMKVIGSGPGSGDSWFEAARTLAFGVATDGGEDENPDPLVRIAFEDLARVAEMHVVEATGIAPPMAGAASPSRRSGRGSGASASWRPTGRSSSRWSRRSSRARPRSRSALDLERARPGRRRRAQRTARPVRPHAWPRLPRHAVRIGGRPPGAARLRPVRAPAPLARVLHSPARAGQRQPFRRRLEPPAAGGAALGLPRASSPCTRC